MFPPPFACNVDARDVPASAHAVLHTKGTQISTQFHAPSAPFLQARNQDWVDPGRTFKGPPLKDPSWPCGTPFWDEARLLSAGGDSKFQNYLEARGNTHAVYVAAKFFIAKHNERRNSIIDQSEGKEESSRLHQTSSNGSRPERSRMPAENAEANVKVWPREQIGERERAICTGTCLVITPPRTCDRSDRFQQNPGQGTPRVGCWQKRR